MKDSGWSLDVRCCRLCCPEVSLAVAYSQIRQRIVRLFRRCRCNQSSTTANNYEFLFILWYVVFYAETGCTYMITASWTLKLPKGACGGAALDGAVETVTS